MQDNKEANYIMLAYPPMEKGEWSHKLLKGESDKALVESFSKIYKCFLVEVRITNLEDKCIVESSIKTPEKIEKYNNFKRFNDECAYAHALEFVLLKELPETERAIDEILSPIKAPADIRLN